MKRILLLNTDLQIGGTPTVVRELALRLHDPPSTVVDVACLSRWGPVADQLRAAGIDVTALGAQGVWELPSVAARLVRLIHDRGIGTVFSFLLHANAVAAIAKLFCPDVRFLQSIQTTQPWPRWHWFLQGIVQHAAEAIVVPSPSVADAAHEWSGIARSRIRVIPNAVDVEEEGQEASGWAEHRRDVGAASEHRQDAGATSAHRQDACATVGFVGRLDRVKRIDDLLCAVAQLPGVHLDIFGEGAERPRIQEAIQALDLATRVRMRGAVARPAEALAGIDVLALPSEAEGFGLVLVEAMSAGVCVVATDAPGIRDVVRHGQTGLLVPVGSPVELAGALHRVMNDAELRETLIHNARRDVRERFSWPVVLPQYRRLLRLQAASSSAGVPTDTGRAPGEQIPRWRRCSAA